RDISSNAQAIPWGGFDNRSSNRPGSILAMIRPRLELILDPTLIAPTPHAFPNAATDPQYIPRPDGGHNSGPYNTDFRAYNFPAITPAIPAADRQSFYGSFSRELCDKYLEVFADFKYTRSFWDSALAGTPFAPDPFKRPDGSPFSNTGISVPIQNAFNPFTVPDATLMFNGVPVPVTTGVRFRAINDQGE